MRRLRKTTETTKLFKICYIFKINRIRLQIVRRRTKMTH